jgi:hypothetical protein
LIKTLLDFNLLYKNLSLALVLPLVTPASPRVTAITGPSNYFYSPAILILYIPDIVTLIFDLFILFAFIFHSEEAITALVAPPSRW